MLSSWLPTCRCRMPVRMTYRGNENSFKEKQVQVGVHARADDLRMDAKGKGNEGASVSSMLLDGVGVVLAVAHVAMTHAGWD